MRAALSRFSSRFPNIHKHKMTKYNCAMCGKEEELTTPIQEMIDECIKNFHYTPTKEEITDGLVCDDCYNKPEITRAMSFANGVAQ